jgi:hypothetical protein
VCCVQGCAVSRGVLCAEVCCVQGCCVQGCAVCRGVLCAGVCCV